MSNLYYIRNIGCDDETPGLARITDEDFPKFKEIIENLNANSTYGCMPSIEVYRLEEDDIREIDQTELEDKPWGVMHLDEKKYKLVISLYDTKRELVISAGW